MTTTDVSPPQNQTTETTSVLDAANWLTMIRVTIGAMFVWVFFENPGKGLCARAGSCRDGGRLLSGGDWVRIN